MIKKKKKGFTMMELLVTVLLIGILAAMAMPQYMKVVEKQKGTETVNLLSVIGKSQERYFAVNEKYTTDFSDLDSDLVDYSTKAPAKGSTLNTKYFVFLLNGTDDNTSLVKATRRGNESYIIERNYTTGDVCCRADNTADADICDILDLPGGDCDVSGVEPTPVCTGAQPADSQTCASGCGSQTRTVSCNNGAWVTGAWTGTCTSPTQTQATSQTCSTGCGTQTRTCTASCGGGTCGAWTGTCTSPTQTQATSQTCSTGCGTQTRTCTASCGGGTCGSWTGTCTSPTQTQITSQACASGCGTQTRTCTASCDGGSCGAWTGTCTSPTQTQATTRSCTGTSQYGTETRTCTATCGGGTCGSWVTSACKTCSWKFTSGYLCNYDECPEYSCPSTCDYPGDTVTCRPYEGHSATYTCKCV